MKEKYKGILYIICSAFCFALMNVFVHLAGDLPSVQKSFFRNFVAFFFALAILIRKGEKFSGKKENFKYLIIRSIAGTMGILCNFYAVDHLVLSDASMLNKMSPFFAILFSLFILKEKPAFYQGAATLIAFLSSLFIIKPSGFNADLFPAFIGLCGGISAGMAYTFVRLLGQKGEKGAFIVCFFSGASCLIIFPLLLMNYKPMSLEQVIILLMAGLFATGGQFGITAAYQYAPAKEISVYDYSQIIFSGLLGFFIFGQMPDLYSVIGYIMICGTALWMFRKDQQKIIL